MDASEFMNISFPNFKGAAPPGHPAILYHPMSHQAHTDDSTAFVCEAEGSPSPHITWYRDYKPIDYAAPRVMQRESELNIKFINEYKKCNEDCNRKIIYM